MADLATLFPIPAAPHDLTPEDRQAVLAFAAGCPGGWTARVYERGDMADHPWVSLAPPRGGDAADLAIHREGPDVVLADLRSGGALTCRTMAEALDLAVSVQALD